MRILLGLALLPFASFGATYAYCSKPAQGTGHHIVRSGEERPDKCPGSHGRTMDDWGCADWSYVDLSPMQPVLRPIR